MSPPKPALASADKRFIMTTPEPNAYLKTKVLTASPAELRLLLFDGAIKFAEQGLAGLADEDHEQAYNGISQCQDVIMELINSLNHEIDPELCNRLSGLYTYMFTRLMQGISERDAAKIEEVLELLNFERETWQMLIDKLAKENAGDAEAGQAPVAPPHSMAELKPDGVKTLLGGTISLEG